MVQYDYWSIEGSQGTPYFRPPPSSVFTLPLANIEYWMEIAIYWQQATQPLTAQRMNHHVMPPFEETIAMLLLCTSIYYIKDTVLTTTTSAYKCLNLECHYAFTYYKNSETHLTWNHGGLSHEL